jgi:hypothetical protein
MQIGRELAYKDAYSQLWALEGYLLAEKKWREAGSPGQTKAAG